MDLFSFLATLILVTTIVTLVISLMAYIAYKVREARKPRSRPSANRAAEGDAPVFLQPAMTEVLERWQDPAGEEQTEKAAGASQADRSAHATGSAGDTLSEPVRPGPVGGQASPAKNEAREGYQ